MPQRATFKKRQLWRVLTQWWLAASLYLDKFARGADSSVPYVKPVRLKVNRRVAARERISEVEL